MRATAAIVDLDALAHNFERLRARAEGRQVIAVIKADAYGHGALAVARRLLRAGCRLVAVATLEELAVLREGGVDVAALVLGGVDGPAAARAALALGATPVLQHEAQLAWTAEAARAAGRRVPVHVEIDTGMRRLGVPLDAAPELLARVVASPELVLAGVATHLACADLPDPGPSRAQLEAFRNLLAALSARGVRPASVHVANSAGLLAARGWGVEALLGDAVRPGLALYGVAPAAHLADPELRPVMTLRTAVVAVRAVGAGEGVGYGHTWKAPRSGWIATLPIGYADGLPWTAAARGSVLIGGRRRPLAGRVSMDLATVWLDDAPAALGEEAIVFGSARGGERLGIEELAAAAGTLPYELLVRVGARVPRLAAG